MSCLQRHEWYKHGTCQTQWSADGYFEHAMQLLADFNGDDERGMAAFMAAHLDRRVAFTALSRTIDRQFGEGAHRRMQFDCTGDHKLEGIHIRLPTVPDHHSLTYLIRQAPAQFRNRCGAEFVVDRIDD